MNVDVLYLAWNRREFTEFTFDKMLSSTNWGLVRQLVVYDDGSEDGTLDWLFENIHRCPVEYHLEQTEHVGPVGVMNHYVENNDSEFFAKIDNDIVVPPGWLERLVEVMGGLDALGMEAGRMGRTENERGWEAARWIGGVGLIRTAALGVRPRMMPNGTGLRYGWTEFQTEYKLNCGWVCPDPMLVSLDQVPLEPFSRLATEYCELGWSRQREWPKYHESWMSHYWDWWEEDGDEAA